MNIILTGLRGSGKTEIGKILAAKLGWDFIDIDEEIEKTEKAKIAKIVELRGWKYFRTVESKLAQNVAKLDNTVIATGGGTILDRKNEKALKKNGKIVYLYVKPAICAARIINDKNRPPLTSKKTLREELEQLYKKRNPRYRESANLILERTNDLEKDTQKIIKSLHYGITQPNQQKRTKGKTAKRKS